MDFSGDSGLLLVRGQGKGPLRLFSMPDALEVRSLPLGDGESWYSRGDRVFSVGRTIQSWPLSGEKPLSLGAWDDRGITDFGVTADGSRIAAARAGRLHLQSLDHLDEPAPTGAGDGEFAVWPSRERSEVATVDEEGRRIRLWSVEGDEPRFERELPSLPAESIEDLALDPHGRFVSARVKSDRLLHRIWDLEAPPDIEPMALRDRDTESWIMGRDFDPSGRWLAVVHDKYGSLWALHEKRPRVLRGIKPPYFTALSFTGDGRYLVSGSYGGEVWRWSLGPGDGTRLRLFYEKGLWLGFTRPRFDPRGRFVLVKDITGGRLLFIRLDGTETRAIHWNGVLAEAAIRSDGRIVAVAGRDSFRNSRFWLSVRDLETGAERTLDADVEGESCAPGKPWAGALDDLLFLPDGRLLTEGGSGLRVFDLTSGTSTRLRPCRSGAPGNFLTLAPDARTLLIAGVVQDTAQKSVLVVFDLETRAERPVLSHGEHITAATLDPAGVRIVTGSGDGLIRVGPLDESEEPHLLYGHTARVSGAAVSPDGHWIASAAEDGTIRLWPMPAGRPLQTLSYEELLAKLRALTNLRVVADAGSATGYKVEPGPFPGWAKFPEW